MRCKKGQVWIETVLYTLIAFAMIGLVLAYAKPKIEEIQDRAVVEKSVEIIEEINNIIFSIKKVPGNQRVIELGITEGVLTIDGVSDTIKFEMESEYPYTEPGAEVEIGGGITAITQTVGSANDVILLSNLSEDYNLTYRGKDEIKKISKSSTAYNVVISNEGFSGNKPIIDFDI